MTTTSHLAPASPSPFKLVNNLLKFNGDGDLNEFIKDKRKNAKLYNWDPSTEARIVRFHLEGKAYDHVDRLRDTLTPDEIYEELRKHFNGNQVKNILAWDSIRPEPNEKVVHLHQQT